MKKRILAMLICLLMTLSLIPAAAYGSPEDYVGNESWKGVSSMKELFDALKDKSIKYVRVMKDLNGSDGLSHSVNGEKVLDLNGKKVDLYSSATRSTMMDVYGDLTVFDSRSGGTIRYEGYADAGYEVIMSGVEYTAYTHVTMFNVRSGGKLRLVSGNYDAGKDNYQYVIYLKNEKTGSRYDGKVHQVCWGTIADVDAGASLMISGGTYKGRGERMDRYDHSKIYHGEVLNVRSGGTVVINDGLLEGDEGADIFNIEGDANITVNGGSFALYKGNRVRLLDSREDSQIVGGRYMDGVLGTVNLDRKYLNKRASLTESVPKGSSADPNKVLYDCKFAPTMCAIYPEFDSTKSSTMNYALGGYEIVKLDSSFDSVFQYPKDALKYGFNENLSQRVEWDVIDTATNMKKVVVVNSDVTNLQELTSKAGCQVGHTYRLEPCVYEHWSSYSKYNVIFTAPTSLTINVMEGIKGTFGWETKPVVGKPAKVYVENLNVPAGTQLFYDWKVSEGNTWKTVSTTKVPEYTFSEAYYNKAVLCDIVAYGYGGQLRVYPILVKYPVATGDVVRPSYSLDDPDYKQIELGHLMYGQDYVLTDGIYTGALPEKLWEEGFIDDHEKVLTSYVDYTTLRKRFLEKNKTYYLYTRKSAIGKQEPGVQIETVSIFNGAGNPKGVILDSASIVTLEAGKTKKISLTYEPANAYTANVTLLTTGGSVASYKLTDKTHLEVQALKPGVEYVYFYVNGNPPTQFANVPIYVYEGSMKPYYAYYTEDTVEMVVGDRYTQQPVFSPTGITASGTWKIVSGNGVVALNPANGQITALKAGDAIVGFEYESLTGNSTTNYKVHVTDPAAAHVHDFQPAGPARPATCLTPEEQDYKCSCGMEMTLSGDAPLMHEAKGGYQYDEFTHWLICKNCGMRMNEALHNIEEDICKICGYSEAHVCTLEKVDAEDETCQENGHGEYYRCTECGRPYSDAEGKNPIIDMEKLIVPKKAHQLNSEGLCILCKTKPNLTTPFTDVPETAYYKKATEWAFNAKPQITDGNGKDKFMPEQICTRGQVVTFLWRALGEPEPKTTANPFTDVKTSDYFYKPVLWAVENGVTDGTAPDKFSPANPCKNSHILTFVWRALGEPDKTGEGTWYTDAQNWAVKNGLLDGTYSGTYDVNAQCPRKNVVEYLYRYYNMK